MPKRFLHNAFAQHIDQKSKPDNGKPYQLSTAGYNCDQDNIVAESPFEGAAHIYENNLPFVFTTYRIDNFSFLSIQEIYSRFRGPPMIV